MGVIKFLAVYLNLIITSSTEPPLTQDIEVIGVLHIHISDAKMMEQ